MKLYTEEEVKNIQNKFEDELKGKPCIEANGGVYIPLSIVFSEEEEKESTGFMGIGKPKIVKGKRLVRVAYKTIKTPDGMETHYNSLFQKSVLEDMYKERNKFRTMEHELNILGFKLEYPKKKKSES